MHVGAGESSLTRASRVSTFINPHKLQLPTSTLLQLQHLTNLEAIRRLKKSKYARCYCVEREERCGGKLSSPRFTSTSNGKTGVVVCEACIKG